MSTVEDLFVREYARLVRALAVADDAWEVTIDIPGAPWPTWCAQTRCYLALKPSQKGSGPFASVPISIIAG